jgi:hypothetical protein
LRAHARRRASHILLTDLCSVARQESTIQRHIKPEKRWEFEAAIRGPQNFLKHADEDPNAVLEFDPHVTELMLLLGIETYRELVRSITPAMNVFLTYAVATWAQEAFDAVPGDVLADVAEAAAGISKTEFFALCVRALARRGAWR